MFIWEDPKAPAELKAYSFDWSTDLDEGDTIASCSAEFVDGFNGGGMVIEDDTDVVGTLTKVWVSGGTASNTARIRGTAVTTGGATLTEIGLLVVAEESDPANATLLQLQADLASLKAARLSALTGTAIKEVWREGRRIVYNVASVADLDRAIGIYEDYVADAQAEVTPPTRRRMRALSVRF